MSDHDDRPQQDQQQPESDDQRNPLDLVADSFLARLRRGEHPSISEYTIQYPELSNEIRSLFPTLVLLEKGGEDLTSPPTITSSVTPSQIGEYQVLREIGRGGMGVVYEAKHQTMQRRVALKVIVGGSLVDPVQLQRFYLEARLAGRLHHTNIVPVFEVGTDGDYHYYAMQFIRGQNLDQVLRELRCLNESTIKSRFSVDIQQTSPSNELAVSVALSLISKPRDCNNLRSHETTAPPTAGPRATSEDDGRRVTTDLSSRVGNGDDDTDISRAPDNLDGSALNGPLHAPTGGVQTELTGSTERRDSYFHRAARVTLQVAEALAYAHNHGILHRDIKPSNIILDTAGVAWVTDFGLAKDEEENLTRSGDIVGTFRYMAPERFQGYADVRSDIYSLGLTLYELCTLRTALPNSNRAGLVRDILQKQPPRPRSLNRDIPPDLETIILKSIEKQPRNRYQAVRHMATDLRLFLSDHPVRARRVSTMERVWRWARRNPQQAILAACVGILVLVVTIGSLRFGYVTSRQAKQLAASKHIATQRLYLALQKSAEASRWSGRPGQHFSSLADVRKARELLPQLGWGADDKQREVIKLRNAAIAAMSLTDVRIVKSWQPADSWGLRLVFSADYASYAQADQSGSVAIRRVADDLEIHRLPAPIEGCTVTQMKFSPDGRYLAATYQQGNRYVFRVWNTDHVQPRVVPKFDLHPTASADFDPRNAWIALANGKHVILFDLKDGSEIQKLTLPKIARSVQVSAQGRIAVLLAGRRTIQVWDNQQSAPRTCPLQATSWAFAWHPLGDRLAIGGNNGELQLVQLKNEAEPVRVFDGHTGRVKRLHFGPRGKLLASQAWDGTLRLWEATSGKQLLRTEGSSLLHCGFSQPDGRFLAVHEGNEIQLWEIARRTPLRILQSPRSDERRWSVDIDPTGRWLASALDAGTELWDVRAGQLVEFLPATRRDDGTSKDAVFLSNGHGLVTSNSDGVRWYALKSDLHSQQPPRWLPPRELYPHQSTWLSETADGSRIAFRDGINGVGGLVIRTQNASDRVTIGPHEAIDHVQISPDGRWVATTTWGGRGIRVWDAQTGKPARETPLEPDTPKANVVFSPDSRWLAASTTQYHVVWDVENWQPRFRVRRIHGDEWPGPIAYSPDGALLAAAHSRFQLSLLDPLTGKPIARLAGRDGAGFHDCCFSPSGNILAAASDTNVHIWDLSAMRRRLSEMQLGF